MRTPQTGTNHGSYLSATSAQLKDELTEILRQLHGLDVQSGWDGPGSRPAATQLSELRQGVGGLLTQAQAAQHLARHIEHLATEA